MCRGGVSMPPAQEEGKDIQGSATEGKRKKYPFSFPGKEHKKTLFPRAGRKRARFRKWNSGFFFATPEQISGPRCRTVTHEQSHFCISG